MVGTIRVTGRFTVDGLTISLFFSLLDKKLCPIILTPPRFPLLRFTSFPFFDCSMTNLPAS